MQIVLNGARQEIEYALKAILGCPPYQLYKFEQWQPLIAFSFLPPNSLLWGKRKKPLTAEASV